MNFYDISYRGSTQNLERTIHQLVRRLFIIILQLYSEQFAYYYFISYNLFHRSMRYNEIVRVEMNRCAKAWVGKVWLELVWLGWVRHEWWLCMAC